MHLAAHNSRGLDLELRCSHAVMEQYSCTPCAWRTAQRECAEAKKGVPTICIRERVAPLFVLERLTHALDCINGLSHMCEIVQMQMQIMPVRAAAVRMRLLIANYMHMLQMRMRCIVCSIVTPFHVRGRNRRNWQTRADTPKMRTEVFSFKHVRKKGCNATCNLFLHLFGAKANRDAKPGRCVDSNLTIQMVGIIGSRCIGKYVYAKRDCVYSHEHYCTRANATICNNRAIEYRVYSMQHLATSALLELCFFSFNTLAFTRDKFA